MRKGTLTQIENDEPAGRWSSPASALKCKLWLAPVMSIAIFAVGCGKSQPERTAEPRAHDDPVAQMQSAMQAGDWQSASQFAQQALIVHPDDPDLLTQAAKAAAFCDRKRDAAKLLVDAAVHADFQPASRVDMAVQALLEVGELYDAIDLLEESVKANPKQNAHRRALVGFLGEAQRPDRIPLHLQQLIRDRNFDVNLLVAVTETSSRRFSLDASNQLLERNPADHRVRLAEAFEMLCRRDSRAASQVM